MRGSHNKSQHFFYPAKCRLPGLKEPKMGLFFSSFYTLYLVLPLINERGWRRGSINKY